MANPGSGLLRGTPAPSGRVQQGPKPIPYLISLPPSSHGPTTCTVFEPDYATQIVVDSRTLDVRNECQVWAANQADVGYLWGYERAVTPDALALCTLMDPNRKMTASVIEDTGFVPVTRSQRAKGAQACAAIVASGWKDAPSGSPRRHGAASRRLRSG